MKELGVSLEEKSIRWLEDKVRMGKFKSISHGIRRCVEIVQGSLDALEAAER